MVNKREIFNFVNNEAFECIVEYRQLIETISMVLTCTWWMEYSLFVTISPSEGYCPCSGRNQRRAN
jgi:hypothetical protein